MTRDNEREESDRRAEPATAADAEPVEPAVLDSRLLMRGRTEVQIRHGSKLYRLRVTSNGKLILNR
ncbi:MAG: hemin uptake protein HemP [Phycisphaerae bacterium]|jgi:hemin uptake protein HemP